MTIRLVYNRKKNNNVEVRIRFNFSDTYLYRTTGVFVEPECWDDEKKVVKDICKDAEKKNAKIMQLYNRFNAVIDNIEKEWGPRKVIDRRRFLRKLGEFYNESEDRKLFFVWAIKEVEKDETIQESTKKNYLSVLRVGKKLHNVTFDNMDSFVVDELVEKLINHYKNRNSAKKAFTIIKILMKKAQLQGKVSINAYERFISHNIKGQETHKDILNELEIKELEAYQFKDKRKKLVKDMFLFAIYTALRHSDIETLKVSNFNYEGKDLIMTKSVYKLRNIDRKVRMNLTKMFDGNPEKLIKPYLKGKGPDDKVFDKIYRHHVNQILQEIANDLEFYKYLTFHVARHTSLTMVAHKTGDVFEVMVHGAISSAQTAMRYVHLSQEHFERKMEKISW